MLWSYFKGLNVSLSDDSDIYYILFIYYKEEAHHDVTEYMNVGHGLYGCRQNQKGWSRQSCSFGLGSLLTRVLRTDCRSSTESRKYCYPLSRLYWRICFYLSYS